jgi:hypothetical protein
MITGIIVSIKDDTFVTDNLFWMGPFQSKCPVKLGDKVYYNPEIKRWVVAI